jgi:hypothetical protein
MVRFSGQSLAFLLLSLAVVSSPANAQTITVSSSQSSIGFLGGLSIDPDQGFVGVFWQSPEIAGRFHVRPGIDGGFGDNLRLATINIDFIARFPLGGSGWDLIQGGGPAIAIARFDGFDDTETDLSAGGSYIFGFAHDSGFLAEFRTGGGGLVPTLKLAAGWALSF